MLCDSCPRRFVVRMYKLPFVILSLVFGSLELFFLNPWTSSCGNSEFAVVPSGPGHRWAGRLRAAAAAGRRCVCRWRGGAGLPSAWRGREVMDNTACSASWSEARGAGGPACVKVRAARTNTHTLN